MFLNFTNQPVGRWQKEQRDAAESFGPIEELAFPKVDPEAEEAQIEALSEVYLKKIREKAGPGDVVLVQGEFTLAFLLVQKMKAEGLIPVSVCMKREVVETEEEGQIKREIHFRFVKFRRF